MNLSFDTFVKTDNGTYQMTLSMNPEQVKYMVEIGLRTLLSMGALSIPPVTHIPDENTEDWKSKLN